MSNIKSRVVDCYIYHKDSSGLKFLILKRSEKKIYEHLWQGVAGKIEKGEEAWQAAIRELKEETGLDPKNMFVADHVSRFYEVFGDRINLVPVFGIEVKSLDVKLSSEHVAFKWVEFKEAFSTLVWNGQKEGIQTVNDMLTSNDDRMRWAKIKL